MEEVPFIEYNTFDNLTYDYQDLAITSTSNPDVILQNLKITESQLVAMTVRELNQILHGISKEDITKIKVCFAISNFMIKMPACTHWDKFLLLLSVVV